MLCEAFSLHLRLPCEVWNRKPHAQRESINNSSDVPDGYELFNIQKNYFEKTSAIFIKIIFDKAQCDICEIDLIQKSEN